MKRPFTMKHLMRLVLLATLFLFHACQTQVEDQRVFLKEAVNFTVSEENQSLLAEAKGYDLAFQPGKIIIQESTTTEWKMQLGNTVSAPIQTPEESEVTYEEAFAGVAVRFYDKGAGNAGYDLHVAPGAEPEQVCIELEGTQQASINEAGELVLPTLGGEIRHSAPFAYQNIGGVQVEVESHFELNDNCLSFNIGEYDNQYELIIDPTIYEVSALEGQMMAPSLSINLVSISGCYLDENGDSKATVSIEVGWADLAASNNIGVKLGVDAVEIDQTVAVQLASGSFVQNARTLASPQLVAFEVPANGAILELEVSDANGVATPVIQNVEIPEACPREACPDQAGVIGGNIFADNDFDGDHDPGEINAFEGVRVDIYECNDDGSSVLLGSEVSDANGDYFFTGLEDGKNYRLEFFPPANLSETKPTTIGNDSKSNVRIVEAPACGIDYGLINPTDYCQENPLMLVPCYGNGDPLLGGNAAGVEALVLFDYNFGTKQAIANTSQIGPIWGVAINRFTGEAFLSTTLRRHSGLGPLGLGGLYVTDMDNPAYPTGPFLDVVADLGLDIGQGLMPANRNLPADKLAPSHDAGVFGLIGKIGIGDIDISEDGNILYFVNLFEKKLVGLDISNYNTSGIKPSAGDIVLNVDIPEPPGGCIGGELRPFAVKVFGGKVYVGMVCDASIGEDLSNLRAIILEYDGAFTEVFNLPLTYPRGSPAAGNVSQALGGGWFAWTDNYSKMLQGTYAIYSQPMLTDIEFDLDGSILIGFLDRAGFQWGYNNYSPNTNDLGIYRNFAGGDVLRAASKGGAFILENNAKAADAEGSNPNNFQGPGNGEFYQDNIRFSNTQPGFHTELMLGGLALLPGSGEVIATCVDPVPGEINANGMRRLSNTTGLPTDALSVYVNSNNLSDARFGKAAGLGDLELRCDALEFIQLGNFVWEDINGDGIQDPCEPGIEGVVVKLYDENGELQAVTETDADGFFAFTGPDFDDPAVVQWENGANNIEPQTNYTIVFGMGQFNPAEDILQLDDGGYVVTKKDQGSGDNQDLVDSDVDETVRTTVQGDIMEGFPFVTVTTGDGGDVNHNLDLGLNRVYDYGDAKEDTNGNFPVSIANNGARHVLGAGLKLGDIVDFEGDGQPGGNADGDDGNGMDDEDGIDPASFMLVRCLDTEMEVAVTVPDGFGTAYLNMWVDLDGDCIFDDNEEHVTSCVEVADGTNMVTINIPCDAQIGNTFLRARISSVCDLGPEGEAPNGEVEDYLVLIKGMDFGDLPEDSGYPTTFDNGGAFHIIPPNPVVYLGQNLDTENDGQPDENANGDTGDEDSFDPDAVMFVAGRPLPLNIPVVNESNEPAKVVVFVDWNKDGDLNDPDEMFFDIVESGETEANINIIAPPNAVLNMPLGFRIRMSTDQDAVMSPVGLAMDGEVEDYLITVMGFDYGDLPDDGDGNAEDDYETQEANGGPSHKIVTDAEGNVILKIGDIVDAEGEGNESTGADGDNEVTAPELNDEDGFNPASVMFVSGTPINLNIPVTNLTGQAAKLTLYVDWNNDGDFDDPEEMYFVEVQDLTNGNVTLEDVLPPLDRVVLNQPLGFRLRLTTATEMSPVGPAPDGEVEDYLITVMGFDYGDLNDVANGTGGTPAQPLVPADYPTLNANNGPRHKIITDDEDNVLLKIGAFVDDEANGQPSEDAGDEIDGDDNIGTPDTDPDDEDGLDVDNLPIFSLTQTTELPVPVMNKTDEEATLAVFLDFNKDGNFDPNTEKFITSVDVGEMGTVTVNIPIPVNAVVGQDVGLRLRLASDMAEVMTATGTATSGEIEDYMVQIVGFDYGDLPDTYSTIEPDDRDAPKHIVDENLLLGSCVDSEIDGIPDPMAGSMEDGDDNDPGLAIFGTCEEAGDDEDGIEFVTPMVPGTQACIEVTAVNNKGVDATLQMWVDWNGDGQFQDVEELVLTSENHPANTIPDGGVEDEKFCFEVPETAVFNNGNAMIRFRLSTEGDLEPDEQTLPVPFGEIEDYKVPLGKIGNLVWEDFDFDGVQDEEEPGIEDVEVAVVWLGEDGLLDTDDDVAYPTLTDENGVYYVCGLIEGNYKVIVQTPEDMTPTRPNAGDDNNDDERDSDGQISDDMDFTMVMSEIITIEDVTDLPTEEDGNEDEGEEGVNDFPDEQVDETVDFGFAGLDYGDLPEEEQDEAFNTTMEEGGPIHVIQPDLYLGSCVDAEREGSPDDDAGQFDNEDGDNDLGDDGTEGDYSNPDDCEDDEDGIEFITPLVPDNVACIRVTYTAPDGGAVLQGWIDWNGNGEIDLPGEALNLPDGGALNGGDGEVVELCFEVPEDAIFNDGVAYARFRLSETGGLGPDGPYKFDEEEVVPGGEVEDYRVKLGKVGNLVWEDRNNNGLQDDDEIELGINGVAIQLVFGGIRPDGTLDAIGDAGTVDDRVYDTETTTREYMDGSELAGLYYYCGLIEGNYEIIVMDPKDLTPAKANNINNVSDEDKDSDGIIVEGEQKVKVAFTFEDQMELMNLVEGEEGIGDQDLDNLLDPNMVGTFADNQIDQRFDFGYVAIDFGDLPVADLGAQYQYETVLPQGPKHIVTPDLFLGTCVDAELDGSPDLEAGYKGNGNDLGDDAVDNDPESWKQPAGTDCTDDEDAIELVTPLVPGYEACLEMTFTAQDNFNGPDAYLNAWIDYNGNGQLDEDEHIEFTKVNGAAASLDPLTKALELENGFKEDKDPVTLCFEVPEDAQFLEGAAFMRFRLSLDPRLGPDDMLPNGQIPYGEVEDYFVPVTKVGNLVWEDRNFNGVQDNAEADLGINEVSVALIFSGKDGKIETTDVNSPQGDDRVYETTTASIDDVAGLYYFCGLIENNSYEYDYKIVVQTPEDMTPTRPDRGLDNVLDSDGEDGTVADGNNTDGIIDDVLSGMVMTEFEIADADAQITNEYGIGDDHGTAPQLVLTFPDEHVNQSFDFGFAGLDYGDLPDDPDNPEDFNTLMTSDGAVHVIQPGKSLGDCVDGEREAAPEDKAGLEEGGDDHTESAFSQPEDCVDDENGVILTTPMVAGYEACFQVTFNWPAGEKAYLSTWIDYNSNERFDAGEKVVFKYNGSFDSELEFTGTGNEQVVELCFIVPVDATFPGGRAHARFRLSDVSGIGPDGPAKYGNDRMPAGEVEDYLFPLSKLGNLVWEDNNLDGLQDGAAADPSEPGFENLEMTLVYAGYGEDEFGDGDDRVYITTTNEEGLYYYCGLIPGTYQVYIKKFVECNEGWQEEAPARWILTVPNNEAGEKGDQLDSDGSPAAMVVIPDPMDLMRNEMGVGDDPGNINQYPDSLDNLTIDFGLIEEPNIEAILNDVGYDYPASFECGHINVIMDLCIKNTEPVPLEKLQAMLNLEEQFGPGFVQFVSADVVVDETKDVEEYPVIDPAYAGGAGNILDGISGLLYPEQEVCIRVTVEIDPDAAGAADPLMAQAAVSAKAVNYQGVPIPDWCNGGDQFMVMDLSNDGKSFQGGYDDFDNKTLLSDCWKDADLIAQNDVVYVPVDGNCQMTITADMLLEGLKDQCTDEFFPLGGFYRVRYNDEEFLGEITIDVSDYNVGEPLVFEVRQIADFCNPVWGHVVPEDKAAAYIPEVNGELMLTCTDVDSLKKYFEADITQDKDDCTFRGVSWDLLREAGVFNIDELQDGCFDICHLDIAISDLFMDRDDCEGSMMLRTIRIKDVKGNVSTVEIPIRFKPIDLILDEIMVDRELDLCAYPGASDNELLRLTGAPYYINGFGDKVYIDKEFLNDENKAGLCNVSIGYEDQILPDNCVRKVIRTWTIWDWCKYDKPITKVQHIKWGQLSAPMVSCPPRHTDTVSTGPFDCTASFIVPAPIVDGCVNNEFEYSVKVYKEQIKRDPTGLPVKPLEYETVLYAAQVKKQADGTYLVGGLDMGIYYIGYNVTDACGNVADEVRCKYVVADKTAPVAVCDDELHVSVGGEGISHITVEDVDEGSWDNCELVDTKIRRGLDSCYDSYLSEVYQIAGIEDLHEIETTDKFGNPLYLYYRVEGGRDTLIMKEFVSDSTFKYYTYWRDELWFTCCDISKGPEDFVRIELKATDAHGNENVCWMDQLIENKQVASCWAPEGFDIACTDLTFDPEDYDAVVAALGEAADLVTVDFNCAATLSDTIKWEPTDCSEGVLTRIFSVTTYTAKGAVVNTCEQVINVYNVNDYLIKFPADAEDTCDGDGGDDLELTTYACDVFAVHRDTAVFVAGDDACFKRYVTYRIINWCEYDGVSLEPTIIPRDVDCDGDFSEPTWLRVEGLADRANRVWIDDDNDPKVEPVITFEREAASYTSLACDDNKEYWITPGYWEYTQVIKVYDDEAPIISFDTLEFCAFGATGAADCQAEVMIPVSVVDSCTELVDIREVLIDVDSKGSPVNAIDELYTASLDGDTLRIASIAGKGLPLGEHKFIVKTADQCGNVANREIPFSIIDCKSPAPICTAILSVDLMPIVENKQIVGGANTVWATDFIASGVIDCTPHEDADIIPGSDNNVRYYVVRQDELLADSLETPTADYLTEEYRSVEFTCDDNGGALAIFVIGVDGVGNFDFCTVMVNVQPGVDPSPCEETVTDTTGRLSIAGLITTMEDELVEGVEVMLSGQDFVETRTQAEGVYAFHGLRGGYDYSITPHLDADPMNGVSTFDLVKITQHILGTELLGNPLLMIAADVNNSESITTIDLIQLRKMILSLEDNFSNNTSWRFIDASYEFKDPSNPWAEPFPEIVNLNDLEDMTLDVDFYAVKIGDVNMSAVANSLDIEERNVKGVFKMKAEDRFIEAGQTYAVTLSSEQLQEVLGYQYTLTFDNAVLELQDIEYATLHEQNIGLRYLDEGVITISWNEVFDLETGTGEESDSELITLHFKAYQSGQLSSLLGISSRYTMAEAYDLNGQLQDVVIQFSDGTVTGVSYELYQNMPNPFMTQTAIGFHLPQADKAEMILRDAKGKVLQIVKGDYHKGYNMIRFERDNLPTGVIYYTLKSGDYTATRRMIIVE